MREIFIERQMEILRIAIKSNDKLEECFIEEESTSPNPSEIYKGVVKNIVPAIKCAFVDIGYKKNGYMYLDSKFNNTGIKKGDEIIVEVIKEELGDKGPKVTNAFTIAARYCVLNTLNTELGFSKKISNKDFIENAVKSIVKPEEVGITIRTNAENISFEIINEEIDKLYKTYQEVLEKGRFTLKPKLLLGTGGALDKVLRDSVDKTTSKIIVNHEGDYEYIKDFIKDKTDIAINVELHDKARSLFSHYGIEAELLALRNHKVQLSCGGYIVIDKTEAMHVVDVNSGKNVKNDSMEKTAYNTNLNAAEEISRQIRLRNLSGIIVVDFIDMQDRGHKNIVLNKLIEGFGSDKNKTVIYPFTELNLVQIARRRRGKTLEEYLEEPCKECHGNGKRLRFNYIKALIKNEVLKIRKEQSIQDIYIEIDNTYHNDVIDDIISFVKDIDALDKTVYVNFINKLELLKVEPIIFANQIRNLQSFKLYG